MAFDVEQFKKEKEAHGNGKGGEFYKLKEGANKLRILQDPEVMQEFFDKKKGKYFTLWHGSGLKGSIRYMTRAWLYGKDATEMPKLVIIKLPFGVMDQIAEFMSNAEYAFTTFPMPYDIAVNVKNAGTLDVEYSVIPARANTPVPEEALQAIDGQKPIVEILDSMKKKSEELWKNLTGTSANDDFDTIEYPVVEDVNPNDIPF